jgi:IMP dehydrogenase
MENYKLVEIEEIEEESFDGVVYDIEVEEDNSFTLSNGAIVHNSVCQTTVKAAAGGGNLTAILECSQAARKHGIPIIADGGISEPGDVIKALVAGASSVMGGKIFVRCPESAAEIIEENGKKFKHYYGMASNMLKNKIYGDTKKHVASEGIAVKYPIGLSAEEFVPEFLGGIRSGFTYCGASNLQEIWKNGELRQTSKASFEKGKPHAKNHEEAEKISD